MSKLSIRSTCRIAVTVSLALSLLARASFADGLLLHDHGDDGIHSHTVTLDDLREGGLRAGWHRNHDNIHDDRNNDSDGGEYADSLFIFVSAPVLTMSIHCSSGAVIPSIRHLSSKILPRSMLPSDPTDTSRFSASSWPSSHPLRPAFALDALLQSSQALLL